MKKEVGPEQMLEQLMTDIEWRKKKKQLRPQKNYKSKL